MKPDAFAIEQAKHFLKNRIVAQAAEEHVSLSNAEIATLTYSEPSASESERKLADEVDAQIGEDEYEDKIATLLRHAYQRDLERGAKDDWNKNLHALRNEDLYVLVMVQSSGIGGTHGEAAAEAGWYKAFFTADILCTAFVAICGLCLFFSPLGSFLNSDLARGTAFVTWVAALWLLGEWSRRRV